MSVFYSTGQPHDLEYSKIRWGWMLALGALMFFMGVVGAGMSFWLTLVSILWLGVFALVSGVVQVWSSIFHHKGWKSRIWQAIIGLLYVGAGLIMIFTPVSAAFWLTIMLAASLIAIGLARMVMAFQLRGQGSVWLGLLFSAIISIVLGVLIFYAIVPTADTSLETAEGQLQWLRSWGWIIGLMVAVEIIIEGASLIALGIAARNRQAAGRTAKPAGEGP